MAKPKDSRKPICLEPLWFTAETKKKKKNKIKLTNSLYVKKIKFPSFENDKLYKEYWATVNKKEQELKCIYYSFDFN